MRWTDDAEAPLDDGNPFAQGLSTVMTEGEFVGWRVADIVCYELTAMTSNRERFGDFASKLLSDFRQSNGRKTITGNLSVQIGFTPEGVRLCLRGQQNCAFVSTAIPVAMRSQRAI